MKIDLHVHTREVSSCGKVPGAEMARLYYEAGYDAIVITDHLKAGYMSEMPLDERVEWYLSGYRAAKKAGDRLGLTVLLGAEVRFYGGDEDFLLFGVQPEDIGWIMEKLDGDIRLKEFHQILADKGGYVLVQAHPFRDGLRRGELEDLDGIEVYNGHPDHNSRNHLAMERALLGGDSFIKTSGSDAHRLHHVARGGMITDCDIHTEAGLVRWLRAHPNGERVISQ